LFGVLTTPAQASDGRAGADEPRRALGRRGEQLAAIYLQWRGYTVLAHNVRSRYGEIDLIVCDARALVFVEIKTRRISAAQRAIRADQQPLLGLGPRQRARLRRLAAAWLCVQRGPRARARDTRIDAIGIVLDTHDRLRLIDHVEDVA
jgi:putative endonuclease